MDDTNKIKELLEKLEHLYALYTESVKNYEDMYRVVEEDFYKRSYRRNIDIFNAKREMINYVYEYFTGKVLK
nr:MAG TPA: hypothetical protein [Bacteriophage sp.]